MCAGTHVPQLTRGSQRTALGAGSLLLPWDIGFELRFAQQALLPSRLAISPARQACLSSLAFIFLSQVLNEYFHNVCELDLVFNFYKVGSWGSGQEAAMGGGGAGVEPPEICRAPLILFPCSGRNHLTPEGWLLQQPALPSLTPALPASLPCPGLHGGR